MSAKFCEFCGNPMESDALFCQNCGKTPTASQASASNAPTPPPPPPQYAVPQQAYYPQAGQPVAAPPQPSYYQPMQDKSPMSVGQFMLTMFVMGIPIVGFIMTLVWAFGSGTNINKKNYARATLIWALIAGVILILYAVVFGAAFASIMNGANYNV